MNNDNSILHNEDSIDFRQLFNVLKKKRLFILGFTGVVTLIVVGYFSSLTTPPPIYKVQTAFLKPTEIATIKLGYSKGEIDTVFSSFLTSLNSKVLQKKVFINGDYLKKIQEKESVGDANSFIERFVNSISIEFEKNKIDFETPHILKIKSIRPVIAAEFLNDLLTTSNKQTVKYLIDLEKLKVSNRSNMLKTQRQVLLNIAKQKRLNEIVALKDAAALASSLSIIESNLSQLNKGSINTNLNISIQSGENIPDWYLYGSRALQKMIESLENRDGDEPFVPKITEIDSEIFKLNSIKLNGDNINIMQVYQSATYEIISPKNNKRLIIMMTFFGSLILSILLAFLMSSLKEDDVTLIQKGT